jgi:glycosyltransferase involved in cell wall biosynthesis
MKILINAISARRGGNPLYIQHILNHYPDSLSDEIFIIAPNSFRVPSGKFIRVKVPSLIIKNILFRYIWEIIFLPNLLVKLKINVLFSPGGTFSGRLPKNCKLVTTFQNMIPFDLSQRTKYPYGYMRIRNWMLERKLLSSMLRSDLVIFISDFARSVIEKKGNNKIINSVTIPHGVDPIFVRNPDKSLPLIQDLPQEYLLYVSTIDVYKSQIEVVQSYSILKSRNPEAPKLILIGSQYKPYGNKVRKLIKRLELEKEIILKDAIPNNDLPSLYQNAKINIFASRTENCPIILLEALASGRPLVVSNCRPMTDFALDAVEYFDPSKPEELTFLLEKLLGDADLCKTLSEKALNRSKYFDWNETAKKTWNSINSL